MKSTLHYSDIIMIFMSEYAGNTINSSYKNVSSRAGTSYIVEKMKKDIAAEKRDQKDANDKLVMGLGFAALLLLFFLMTGNK